MKGFNSGAFSEKSKNSKYGIVYTTWNTEIVSDLLEEACKELIEQGVDYKKYNYQRGSRGIRAAPCCKTFI